MQAPLLNCEHCMMGKFLHQGKVEEKLETNTHAVLNAPCLKVAQNCFHIGVAQQLQMNRMPGHGISESQIIKIIAIKVVHNLRIRSFYTQHCTKGARFILGEKGPLDC